MLRLAALFTALSLVAVPAAVGKVAKNPENDKSLGPTKSAGYFLGYPSPTYQWHGCTKSDTRYAAKDLITGQPTTDKSTSRYVTFTLAAPGTYPQFSWKAKAGYKICGAQAAVQMTNKDVDSDLLGETGYTSGPTEGSTAPDGREKIQIRIPKNGIRAQGFEKYEGKTFSIFAFQSVTVFVKKK